MLTRGDIDALRRNPQLLTKSGYLKVKSSYEITKSGDHQRLMTSRAAPFRPRFEQQMLSNLRRECRKRGRATKIILAKARAVGASVWACAETVSTVPWHELPVIICVSVDPAVKNAVQFRMMSDMLKTLPAPLTPKFSRDSENGIILDIPETNNRTEAYFYSAMLKERTAVGMRALIIWVTEYAKFSAADDVMRTLNEVQNDTPEAMFFKESTCEGRNNLHCADFMHAWNLQGMCNFYEPNFDWESNAQEVAVFFPWFHSPLRIADFQRGADASMMLRDLIDYEQEAYHKHLKPFAEAQKSRLGLKSFGDVEEYCMRQLYWHRAYCAKLKEFDFVNRNVPLPKISINPAANMITKKREIPLTVDEAFTDDATSVFDEEKVAEHASHCRPPLRGTLDESGHFIEDPNGWLKTWFTREQIDANYGFAPPYVFFLGSDVAHGDYPDDEKSDYSTLWGWQYHNTLIEQVLEVEERYRVPKFIDVTDRVIRFLSGNRLARTPYYGVECADAGRGIAQHFADDERFVYTGRLYYSQRASDVGRPMMKGKAGFEPTIKALDLLAWKTFENMFNDNQIIIRSRRALTQIQSLIRKPDGRLSAPHKGTDRDGSKDDLVDGARIALWQYWDLIDSVGDDLSLDNPDIRPDGRIITEEDILARDDYDQEKIELLQKKRESQRHDVWDQMNTDAPSSVPW